MTTKYWDGASGDWFGTGWSVRDVNNYDVASTAPVSGDIAVIDSSTPIINGGTLSGIEVSFGQTAALDITNGVIDAQSIIETLYTGASGTVIFHGSNNSLAGKLVGQFSGLNLTVDLENATLNVTSAGQILARSSGTVVIAGTAGSLVTNAGTIQAGVYVGNNTYEVGVVTSSEAIDNTGSISVFDYSTATLGALVTNEAGATINEQNGTLHFAKGLTNLGSVVEAGGTVTVTGSLANSGTVNVSRGTLTVVNASGGLVSNSGTIQVGSLAGVDIYNVGQLTSSEVVDNTNRISVLALSTAIFNAQVTNESAGTIADSGALQFNAGLINRGTVTQTGGTVAIANGLTNSGTVTISGGTLSISGGVANDGTMTLNAATTVTGGITGSGTMKIGDDLTLRVSGGVSTTEKFSFATGVGILSLATPATFAGTITNLSGHDLIDLQGLANATAVVNAGTVTVSDNGVAVLTFTATGLTAGSLNSVSDGNGGTILTLKQPGTEVAVVNALVNGASGVEANKWATTTVTYSFDSGSSWSAAEQQSFVNGLGLWSAVANITFVKAATGATGELSFTRGHSGAVTNQLSSGGDFSSEEVSIDTTVPSFANLVTFGTADTSGYGGYGWQTLLHEEGHVLGLHHPGNYNETADLASQQNFYTDTHQYTLMSYFAAQYSGSNWTIGSVAYNAETPMLFDIAAAQQIYGANTATLAGNDTFGFNASTAITGNAALNQVYNFNTNNLPIVTLWDGGRGNKLDLSGYGTASTVNLNAGTFSSFNGLTDNLAIAYNTAIDGFVGGAGNDIITVNTDADVIDGGGGSNTAVFGGTRASYTLSFNGGTVTVRPMAGGNADTLTNIQTLRFSDASAAACFLRGTRIRTERGDVRIEDIVPGEDWAITVSGHAAKIIWLGWRHVELRRHPRPWDVMPVRIRAGAFGPNLPARDLVVSPDHALLLDDVLIPARLLINGATVVQETHDTAMWYHIELEWHEAILAENLATESYLDTGNRHAFDNGGAPLMLHANFAASSDAARLVWAERGVAPIVTEGDRLVAIASS